VLTGPLLDGVDPALMIQSIVRWFVEHGPNGVTVLDNVLLLPPDDGGLVHKYRVYLAGTARADCTNSFVPDIVIHQI
jgi:hypothetical protein